MKQPIGFEVLERFVDLSNLSTYNAGFQMYTPVKYLLRLYFARLRKKLISVVWVDDMVGIVNTKGTDGEVMKKFTAKYEIKVFGERNIPLGMHITHEQ